MNTKSLVNLISEDIGLTKVETESVLKSAFTIIRGIVASGEAARLPEFGTFYTCHISDIDERNPQAGDPIDDVRVVRFLPTEAFRKEVNHQHPINFENQHPIAYEHNKSY